MTHYTIPPTHKQMEFVQALQRKLHLTDAALNQHCRDTFGASYQDLDRGQVSDLIDQMKAWERMPADLQRAQGQLDLLEGLA